jgi:hypothetical protein
VVFVLEEFEKESNQGHVNELETWSDGEEGELNPMGSEPLTQTAR